MKLPGRERSSGASSTAAPLTSTAPQTAVAVEDFFESATGILIVLRAGGNGRSRPRPVAHQACNDVDQTRIIRNRRCPRSPFPSGVRVPDLPGVAVRVWPLYTSKSPSMLLRHSKTVNCHRSDIQRKTLSTRPDPMVTS